MARLEIPQKMKEWSLWALWWLLLGGATLWLLVGSVAYWVLHGWLPNEAASWVQAFGSIAALAVALWLAKQEGRSRDVERQQREFSYMLRAVPLVTAALEHIRTTCQLVRNGDRTDRTLIARLELLGIIKTELDGFEYVQFANDDVADGWLEMKSAVAILMAAIERALADPAMLRLISTDGFVEKAEEANHRVAEGLIRYGQKVGKAAWRDCQS